VILTIGKVGAQGGDVQNGHTRPKITQKFSRKGAFSLLVLIVLIVQSKIIIYFHILTVLSVGFGAAKVGFGAAKVGFGAKMTD
jgi:hypothetical protein